MPLPVGIEPHRPSEIRETQDHTALDEVVYRDLPGEAEAALSAAGRSYGDDQEVERQLARARRLAPGHLAVTVAEYRYHFYAHHYDQAAQHAVECLSIVAARLGVPSDFAAVRGDQSDFAGDSRLARFWLAALQAYGYVLLRLDNRARGLAALEKVAELDRDDRTKTRVLLEVIARAGLEEA